MVEVGSLRAVIGCHLVAFSAGTSTDRSLFSGQQESQGWDSAGQGSRSCYQETGSGVANLPFRSPWKTLRSDMEKRREMGFQMNLFGGVENAGSGGLVEAQLHHFGAVGSQAVTSPPWARVFTLMKLGIEWELNTMTVDKLWLSSGKRNAYTKEPVLSLLLPVLLLSHPPPISFSLCSPLLFPTLRYYYLLSSDFHSIQQMADLWRGKEGRACRITCLSITCHRGVRYQPGHLDFFQFPYHIACPVILKGEPWSKHLEWPLLLQALFSPSVKRWGPLGDGQRVTLLGKNLVP